MSRKAREFANNMERLLWKERNYDALQERVTQFESLLLDREEALAQANAIIVRLKSKRSKDAKA